MNGFGRALNPVEPSDTNQAKICRTNIGRTFPWVEQFALPVSGRAL
jgi:hypothetical protein